MVKEKEFFLRYSPNHNARPAVPISMIILHYTGMSSGEEALEWLCNPQSKVSAHYLVEEDGTIFALVEEDRRAWHAGVAAWKGQTNINDRSIGIEIVNPGHEHGYRPFAEVQMEAVRDLTHDVMMRHDIHPRNVLAHSDVAPLRKKDPGELFDWAWLAEAKVGMWPEVEVCQETRMMDAQHVASQLHAYGYMMGQTEEEMSLVIQAFQRHFVPEHVTGIWDMLSQVRLNALLAMAD